MRGLVRRTLIPALLLTCLQAFSQESAVIHICVAMLRSSSNVVSAAEVRDRLVKALNQRKPEKKLQMSAAAFPLADTWGTEAMDESRQKSCEFVLSTRLTELQTSSILSAGSTGADYVPSFNATVEYQLIRTSDGTVFATAAVQGQDLSSMEDAVWQAIGHVAAKALPEIAKSGNAPGKDGSDNGSSAQSSLSNQPLSSTPKQVEVTTFAADPCVWLPTNIPHAEDVSGVCHFAMSLPQKMPNFICDQAASRYRGKNKVPFDLVTAAVRYEDGNETYSDIKVNGQPKPEAITQGPGLWSTGEFGSNLRSIFDIRNQALFDFARGDKWGEHSAWVFTYTIVKQNDPLWRLHGGSEMLAPPYRGELWVDQKTGELLRFGSVATNIPKDFPMATAELQIDYANVAFADGSSFVLPADFTVTTSFRGQEATRNLVQFRSCHKFRAKTRMLLDVAAGSSVGDSSVDATSYAPSAATKAEDDSKVYDILREQALREDAARLERETNEDLAAATAEAFRKVREREAQRQKYLSDQAAAVQSAAKQNGEHEQDHREIALSALPKEEPLTTLRVSVKLVPVSVVLRDSKGNVTGNLRKEDFQLFDNGKAQVITSFSVEKSGTEAATPVAAESPVAATGATGGSASMPAAVSSSASMRNVAYVFDDIHSTFSDLANARDAAARHLGALRPEDRAAVFTTSGQIGLSFTEDRAKLQEVLKRLKPHPLIASSTCPPLTQYTADLVAQGDWDALAVAIADTVQCAFGGMANSPTDLEKAARLARATALEVSNAGAAEIQSTLSVLRDVVRRTSAIPGTRSIVLVSPGFLTQAPEARQTLMELVDQALRANIIIHTLDVKGLSTMGVSGNRTHPGGPDRMQLASAEASAQSDVMAELAYGTGGTYFHNNNDADEGFRRTADAPDYIYVLGFSPEKLDGKFHKLKVTLSAAGKSGPGKLTVQARQGYYAAKPTSGS